MRFDYSLGPTNSSRRRPPGPVRRVLVLADVRGNGIESGDRVLDRPIAKIDIDSLDDVLLRHAPVVQLAPVAGGERVEIRRFDDFHPDTLVERLSMFQRLREIRARLENPRTFADAVAELQADIPAPALADVVAPSPPRPDSDGSTLDRLLGRTGPVAASAAPATPSSQDGLGALDALIRDAIAPHIVPSPNPQLPQMRGAVDAAMTDLMRSVLHDPAFQAVESAWRAVQWLVSTLELGESLELHLLHVTHAELGPAATQGGDLWRRLVDGEGRPGGRQAWSVVVGNVRFGASADDLDALERLGTLAAALDAPFLAEASSGLLGTADLASQPDPRGWTPMEGDTSARWQAFLARPAASRVGLALPRFLLRLPYGQRTDPITAFAFEEQPPRPGHEAFLWGNPAMAYGVAIARGLDPEGDASNVLAIEGLPAFVFAGDDGPILQPPAEVALTERAVEAIQARGLLPLIAARDRVLVQLVEPYAVAQGATEPHA
jgi:type VI secretion system protein ImpC